MEVSLRVTSESKFLYIIETFLEKYFIPNKATIMLTLTLPMVGKYQYPTKRFGGLNNLLNQTSFNKKAFREFLDRSVLDLNNANPLVGILQHLSIDPSWDLDQVIAHTRFSSYSLCSVFNITSPQKIGSEIIDGFYREGVREQWVLIDNTKTYDPSTISQETLRGIVPLYSTVAKRGYLPTIFRTPKEIPSGFAIIGIDVVELAIGWWLWMNEDTDKNRGISAYLCQWPLYHAQLIHNELAIINGIKEFLVYEVPLSEIFTMDNVNFITATEHKLIKEHVTFYINWASGNRLVNVHHLMEGLHPIYRPSCRYSPTSGKMSLFAQSAWAFEPRVAQWMIIYLSIANRMKYKATDINVLINRVYPVMKNNYQRIPDMFTRNHMLDLADLLNELNEKNKK